MPTVGIPAPRPPLPTDHRSLTVPPAQLPISGLQDRVSGPRSRCASSPAPDAWEPEATQIGKARKVGRSAIEQCMRCPVRAYCLELEMRDGKLGGYRDQRIRAGFTGEELRAMRPRWLNGESVLDLLWPVPPEQDQSAATRLQANGREAAQR